MHIPQTSIVRKNKLVKESLRKLLTNVNVHRQGTVPDIYLLSIPRSGSTWLMEVLSYEPGLRFVNEPFNEKYLRKSFLSEWIKQNDIFFNNTLFDIPFNSQETLESYLKIPQYTQVCGQYNLLRKNFHLVSHRRLFKLIHVNPVINHFLEQDSLKVYLIRHPASLINSNLKVNVDGRDPLNFAHFLSNKKYVEKYLNESQVDFLYWVGKQNNSYQKMAASWSLRQLPAWYYLHANPAFCPVISYEQLVSEPEKVMSFLSTHLQLSKTGNILQAMNTPSASTIDQRVEEIRDRSEIISKWRRKISQKEEKDIFDVINKLEVGFYEQGNDYPVSRFLL